MKKNIKIFLSYHKDSVRISSEILTPIHVGRALASQETKDKLCDIIGDDTGDNISSKNPNYCELTAQYWAWKNCDADYIGFMHYRRHLNFNVNMTFPENCWGVISENFFSEQYIKKFGLSDDNISNIVCKYDIITVSPWSVCNANSKNIYDHYKSSDKKLFIKDYDHALNILKKLYPNYTEDIDIYNNQNLGYFTNIFIMKKEIFNEYCEWLFNILFKLEKETDISTYDFQEARIYGYISEWLFGIFINHKYRTSNYKIKELQRTFLENTDRIYPDDIHVCFSCDNGYSQHLGVAIASIIANKKISDHIFFYILDGGISSENRKKLLSIVKNTNTSIIFITVNNESFKNFPIYTIKDTHISLAAYYRLSISSILTHIDKVLYIDCDVVVTESIYDLYHTNLDNNYFMGVIDILFKDNTQRLGIKKYANSGVILINLKKWRKDNIQQQLFSFVVNHRERILYHDQDVLNCVLQEHMAYLDKKWNAQTCEYRGAWDGGWNDLGQKAAIIHFISDKKPWTKGNRHPFQKEYFKYLALTPWKNQLVHLKMQALLSRCYRIKNTENKKRIFVFNIQVYKKAVYGNKTVYSILGLPVMKRQEDNNRKDVRILGIPFYRKKLRNYFICRRILFFKINKYDIARLTEEYKSSIMHLESKIDSMTNTISLMTNTFNRNKKNINQQKYNKNTSRQINFRPKRLHKYGLRCKLQRHTKKNP